MQVITQKQVDKVMRRKLHFILQIYFFTGVWAEPAPHPYLRPVRFCWSSVFPKTSIVGNHSRISTKKGVSHG